MPACGLPLTIWCKDNKIGGNLSGGKFFIDTDINIFFFFRVYHCLKNYKAKFTLNE